MEPQIHVGTSRCPLCGGFWEEHKLKLKYPIVNIQHCNESGKYFVEIVKHKTRVIFDDEEDAYRFQRRYLKTNRTFTDVKAALKIKEDGD